MNWKTVLLASAVMALACFSTGCSSACDDLADQLEACCDKLPATSKPACDALLEGIEDADDDACQEVLDAGTYENCG